MTPATPHPRPAHRAYVDHLLGCPLAERGAWCPSCLGLCRAADAESWHRRPGASEVAS